MIKLNWLLVSIVLALAAVAFAQTTYTIVSEGTEARFLINEVLLGNDKQVVGVTSLVTGEISFDPANPQAASVGIISINAADITTDDNRRNNQIRGRILQTEAFPEISFEPTSITGLPQSAAPGDRFDVQITGLLSIAGTSLEKTFDVSVILGSESELSGQGSTMITHKEFNLSIPRVPLVASVEDEVRLELDFRAIAE